jgi:hypothetical protein
MRLQYVQSHPWHVAAGPLVEIPLGVLFHLGENMRDLWWIYKEFFKRALVPGGGHVTAYVGT